jgi:hypothetical protein
VAVVDAQLADTIEEFRIPEQSRLQPNDAQSCSLDRTLVFQTVEPTPEGYRLPDFEH